MSNTYHHRRVTLTKRPPLVRSSSPMTTYSKPKKSVRFCDNESLENVRLFLKTQMPKACRSDPNYPVEYNYQLRLSNWPTHKSSRTANPVKMEHIELIPTSTTTIALVGTCQVANLAFEKHVVIRYSLDHWVTVKEVNATYKESVAHSANTWDRFCFKIVLNSMHHHAHETLYLAVKYTVSGREFWDNNDKKDYKLDIVPHIQLQEDDLSSSSSSSSDDEEDEEENTFDDCNTTFVDNHSPFKLDTTKKPTVSTWSPPPSLLLSPTTPVDTNPLWINSSITNNNKNTFFTDTNYHELLRKYCYNRQQHVYTDPKPIQF